MHIAWAVQSEMKSTVNICKYTTVTSTFDEIHLVLDHLFLPATKTKINNWFQYPWFQYQLYLSYSVLYPS